MPRSEHELEDGIFLFSWSFHSENIINCVCVQGTVFKQAHFSHKISCKSKTVTWLGAQWKKSWFAPKLGGNDTFITMVAFSHRIFKGNDDCLQCLSRVLTTESELGVTWDATDKPRPVPLKCFSSFLFCYLSFSILFIFLSCLYFFSLRTLLYS